MKYYLKILGKGFGIYCIMMITTIIIIATANIIDISVPMNPKEHTNKGNICMLLFIGPFLEEIIHRLWLSLNKRDVLISIVLTTFIYLGQFFHVDNSYIGIVIKIVVSLSIGIFFFYIPQKQYDEIKKKRKLYGFIIALSIIWFSVMHLGNYNWNIEQLHYLLIACLPQLCAGVLLTYYRLKLGLTASISTHILMNCITFLFT